MKVHLKGCPAAGRFPIETPDISEVDCRACIKRDAENERLAKIALAERRWEAAAETHCRAVGMGHLWDGLSANSAEERMVRGMLAAVAAYFVEARILAAEPEEEAA